MQYITKMKVDTNRLKKGTSELTPECRQLIEAMAARKSKQELLEFFETLRGWIYGKCELYHWIEILDRFDDILAEAAKENDDNEFSLFCDTNYTPSDIRLLLYVINFTTLLIEHSFSRHLYNSIEHLTQLLSSINMDIVMCVLNLLYMFSKRSNFIPRLSSFKKVSLLNKLFNLAESWGGKDNGFSLAQCCHRDASMPMSSSTLYFEYYNTGGELEYIEVPGLDKMKESAASIAKVVCDKIPHLGNDQRMHILTRIRLAATFRNYRMRLHFVQARLQAISVLVYSNALQDNIHTLLYPGFVEELVELLEMKDTHLVEIRAAALRTLTSIIHLDRNPHFPKKPGSRLSKIIEVTGAAVYHGFLPTLVRACINHLIAIKSKELDLVAACSVIHQYTSPYKNAECISLYDHLRETNQFPLSLATALFSFLYHLASYEAGGEALVSCGMMESLLRVINWPGVDLEHITFVTRAVRVIDLITNIDMHAFHNNNGLGAFIARLETEVNHCRQLQLTLRDGRKNKNTTGDHDYLGRSIKSSSGEDGEDDSDTMESDGKAVESGRYKDRTSDSNQLSDIEINLATENDLLKYDSKAVQPSTSKSAIYESEKERGCYKKITCVTQRAALLKSMLNFLKKSIQDNNGMRNIMEGSLPRSLRNIISNAEYYGPSLFLLATDVVTVHVFHEPSLLCTLQDSGLTDVVLQSILRKEFPATREVLGSLPNIFSALCLNTRGLEEFSSFRPFERIFRVLLSPDYLVAMRRRRSSDPLGDTATNLGHSMDDLMKHHPSLRKDATKAIIKLLIELVRIGSDPHFICWRANTNLKTDSPLASQQIANSARHQTKDIGHGSGGDDDDDEEVSTSSQQRNAIGVTITAPSTSRSFTFTTYEEREPVPLIDYILNVMKFLDAIISNGANGAHCREFVSLGGLQPLLSILSLPNLPVDSPVTTTAQAVAPVCKSILNLAHETKVIEVAILKLSQIVQQLNPLVVHMTSPEGSILLKELLSCPKIEDGFSNAAYTPLLHSMSSVHGYVVMLTQICRGIHNDVRLLLLRKWGIDCIRGRKLLQRLAQLYTSLVWESTILLGMCTDENVAYDPDFNYGALWRINSCMHDVAIDKLTESLTNHLSQVRDVTPPSVSCDETTTATITAPISVTPTQVPPTVNSAAHTAAATVSSIQGNASQEDDNMEIDDDVVCLTPMTDGPQNDQDVVIEVPDETISLDSSTSSSSSDSVVFIPPDGSRATDANKVKYAENSTKSKESKDTNNTEENNAKSFDEESKRRERAIAQLRHIKALLAASSRFGRALAELFGNLVKLCVAVPGRQKRGNEQETTIKFPYTEAGEIARVLSCILVNGFRYDKIITPSVPKLKLTFLICSVGFTGPMLFDEKRFAFHLMLSHFCEEGGLEAFFEMFRWGLTYGCTDENKEEFMKGNEYPDGAGEFLDAWLLLLEKMVNPRAIFDSPHIITRRPNAEHTHQLHEFEPIFYMIKIHTLALKTICGIWDKKPLPNYGTRMAESILTIVKHIVKSDAMLREKFEKRREEIEKYEEEERQRQVFRESIRNSVNMNHLRLFMDMGFSERHVNEALANTNSIEQATDYLLNRPESANMPRIISVEHGEDDDEEENDEYVDVDEINLVVRGNRRVNINAQPRPQPQAEPESQNKTTWKNIQLPDSETIENFCREAFDKAFNIMDSLPETVASGADLLAELYRRQPLEMKQKFLLVLVQNITDWTEKILHNLKARDALNAARREEILIGRHGMKMYIRLKVGCLLLDEMYKDLRKSFCIAIKHEKSLSTLIMLLHKIESTLQEQIALGAPPITPRWLQYLIEFIDSIDNAYLVMQRKSNMIAVTTKTWKWFDSSAGKWNTYSTSNNNIIHNAFAAGERSVRITCGRQKYIINFNCMSQVNEGTGNHRPIIPGLKVTELGANGPKIESSIITSSTSSESESDSEEHCAGPSENATQSSGSQVADIPAPSHSSSDAGSVVGSVTSSTVGLFDADDDSKLDDDDETDSGKRKIILHEEATGLQQYDTGAIVSCLTRLLRPRLAIDLDTINSILKLCVRLTKEYENAKVFAQNDGIRLLLNMRQMCGYMGSPTYAILLIRHALEEPHTLQITMEREIASRTMSSVPSAQRDIIYVLRQMSSAVARDPKIFIRAASNVLRLDYTVLKNKTDCYDDSRLIVKAASLKKSSLPFQLEDENAAANSKAMGAETEVVESVINDLLKALVLPCKHFPPPPSSYNCEAKPPLFFGGLAVTKSAYDASDGSNLEKNQVDDSQSEQCCNWHLPSVAHLHDKPLLSRSRILKILTDAVRSYQAFIPKIIIDHIYAPSDSVLIKKEQSALSFILDQFLPHKENLQDREVSTMARVLITSLSECVDQSAIQNKVITEVKMAILRAADLLECPEKHLRLQVFVSLLPTMIENPIPLNVGKQPHRAEIFLIMLRKGLMSDLAKMILYLDLSNPSTVATLNAVLKPMETLLRLTISPGLLSTKKKPSQLQCTRRSRVQSSSASGGRATTSSRQSLSQRTTNTLEGDTTADRPGAAGFFFSGDLARSSDQFSHIFDGILENEQEFFNGTVVLGRAHSDRQLSEGLNDNESPNVDVAFETSSESSDSESNASEDNDDREADDDDANEEQAEDRSEADVDEETRQFIEVFDHVYAPDQPRSSSNDRHLDGVPIIRYTVSTNLNSTASGASISSASGSGGTGLAINDNRISNLVNQARQHRNASTISSRSFNPIQQQRPNINIGIIRSTPTAGTSAGSVPSSSNNINDDLLARFNYYIHHGQQVQSGSGAVASSALSGNGDTANGVSVPTVSANLSANSSTTSGVEYVSDNQTGSANSRLSRDSQRLLFVDQQYCSTLSFNISDESQGDINKDALYWWLEEAKHLDMESQPDICLTTAHQLIPNLQEFRDKANKRKRKANFSVEVMVGSPERQDPGGITSTPILTLSPTLASNPLSVLNRRSAIPVLLSRNSDQRETSTATAVNSNANLNDEEMGEHNAGKPNFRQRQSDDFNLLHSAIFLGNTRNNARRLPGTRTSTNTAAGGRSCETSISTVADDSDDSENPLASLFLTEEPGDMTVRPLEADLQPRHQSQIISNSYSNRQRLGPDVANPTMVSLPDGEDEEDDDLEDDDDDEDDEEHREIDETGDIDDENEENEDEEDDEEDLNVEDVIMDFDDEIQNVLQQFSTATSNRSGQQRSQAAINQLNRNSSQRSSALYDLAPQSRSNENESASASTSTETNNIPSLSQTNNTTRTNLVPNVSGSRSSTGATPRVQEMSAEVREVLGDLQVPEGVDPSFLAALPVEMREEVIQEHLRAQRTRQRAQQNAIETEHESLVEVNPDFLAALPPNIQAEVLSQQRIEQQRQAAQSANPNDPVDAAAFFQNLQPALRQAILTDMEDSQIASLPPDLVAEAQNLRRDWEHRNRQVMQERLATTQNNSNSTPSLGTTSTYIPPRIPSMQNLRDRPGWQANSIWYNSTSHASCSNPLGEGLSQQQQQGKSVALALMENEGSLLDVDALTSLLLMLFIEDGKFNIIRLHRVIRHLCYHVGTREWIIDSLIAIIQMADETDIARTDDRLISKPQHINLRVDGALGYRSSVLLIKHGMQEMFQEEPYCGIMGRSVRIHPQAAQMVCRNALDLLITLARHFPRDFVPFRKAPKTTKGSNATDTKRSDPNNAKVTINSNWTGVSCTNKPKKIRVTDPSPMEQFMEGRDEAHTFLNLHRYDFFRKYPIRPPTTKKTPTIFDVILKLDGGLHQHKPTYSSKEVAGMFVLYPQPNRAKLDFLSFEESPFGQLISILPSNIIKQSQQLTDKLVRLLASLGMELPKEDHIQPFAVEDDPIDVAELSVIDQPSTLSVSNAPPSTPTAKTIPSTAKVIKSTKVINVHNSDSEIENIDSSDDDESGNEHSSNGSKQRRISKGQKLQQCLYPSQVQHLKIAIEVLTTKSCSEEGLEYASELIVHFSQCSGRANAIVVQLLIRGIMGLAELVRKQIIALMKEVKEHNRVAATQKSSSNKSHTSTNTRSGVINDRFTSSQVIISAPTKGKPTCELQLPTMAPLVAKSSSQTFFLRTLKVFMQVRDLIEYMALLTLTEIEPLSEVIYLDDLWNTLSECLVDLETTNDPHAVLILQPAVEAFFLIHASKKKSQSPTYRQNNQTPGPRTGPHDTFPVTRRPTTSAPSSSESSHDLAAGERSSNSAIDETMDQESNDSNTYVYFNTSATSSATATSSNMPTAVPSTSAAATAAAKKAEIQKRDQQKFLAFAEKHRTVLNQILRQSTTHLSDGPFSVLVDHTRILDFDVKRKYFRTELERMDEGVRREELTVNVKRVTVFEDSFRELYRRGPEEWKNRFYIVFEDEEGQDAGGLLREWYVIISREIFNPMYALFCVSPGDRVTYMINPSSHANPNHLCYFKFVGRVIAKAIHDNKLLECYFTRSFYKHILGIQVKYTDMESQDYEFYKGLAYLMNNDISTLGYDLTFSTEVQEFGVTQVRDLKPNGRNIPVTEENKFDYIRLVCQLKMSGSIRQQLNAFLEGFYDIIPKRLISIFNEQELELLISGLPNVDIEDLKQNTEYHKYNSKSLQIQWFWRALRSFDQADRAKFLQFVTGTSKVPLQGFSALEGMNGIQKFQIHRDDRSTDRLPCAHTCFNQLDLPLYKSYEKLRTCLTKAIHECSEGFGFA